MPKIRYRVAARSQDLATAMFSDRSSHDWRRRAIAYPASHRAAAFLEFARRGAIAYEKQFHGGREVFTAHELLECAATLLEMYGDRSPTN